MKEAARGRREKNMKTGFYQKDRERERGERRERERERGGEER